MFTHFLTQCLLCLLKREIAPVSVLERSYFSDFSLKYSGEPGLLKPEHLGKIYPPSLLEYVAFLATAFFYDYSQALSVYYYGRSIKVKLFKKFGLRFFYNPINPGLRFKHPIEHRLDAYDISVSQEPENKEIYWEGWIGRYPWLICHMQICAWMNPSFFLKLSWAFKVFLLSLSRNPKDHLLGYLLVSTQRDSDRAQDTLLKLTGGLWERRFLKMYPQGLGGVFQSILGPNHPLSKQWPKEF